MESDYERLKLNWHPNVWFIWVRINFHVHCDS